jgi:hypothetical protein
MGFVHQQHQIGQPGQVVKIALPDVFRQPLDARAAATTHFRVDLGNVEDVYPHAAEQRPAARVMLVVVVAGDDRRRVDGEFRDAPEHVLGMVAVAEVGNQLVVDGQVRRQHEKVVDAVRQVQVADESAHQPRLAHASGQREAQRGKVALEVFYLRKLAADRLQHRRNIRPFAGRGNLRNAVENFQRTALRRTQTETAGNGIDVAVQRTPSLRSSSAVTRTHC